ncbi:hypothetical protein A1Q2_01212 [Trichosporon asahii var. asahii CBS 8904]|uniref:Uncharacterized protein n=1 Tax=Trichosporon asahii var. asahii (strain CBS 8904) TaxID=1220162 RepID=K1VV66_TRIAC|nr:hypothetical protein A1Q2_01212 [Trichosporon asahii var. asahii CBS 8904]
MSTRRAGRGLKVAHPAAPTSNRLLSTQTFTLIASWKGQLVICTVVLVVGAIYFVVREPIREWRERQRERMSRAFTEELLSMEKKEDGNVGSGDRNRAGPSTVAGTSTAVATAKTMNARERGREKRKEKKRKEHLQNANGHAAPRPPHEPGPSSKPSPSDQSPARVTETLPGPSTPSTADTRDASMTVTPASCPTSMGPQPSSSTSNANNEIADNTSSPPPQVGSELEVPSPPIVEPPASPETMKSHSPPLSPRKTHTSEHQPESFSPGTPERRDSHSSSRSRSYSIIPDPSYLPPHHHDSNNKKKKRKPKSRQASAQQQPQPQPPQSQQKPSITAQATPMSRIVTTSSEDAPRTDAPRTPRTPMIPIMSPDVARRRIRASGVELPPEVEVLLDSHEHTIDSLRAEIGRATAEECKARDDEVRAREELRRSRATEDRMRSDYERARKMRDRAEQEARRMEGEVQMIWNRFETLSHMYQAVCQRLREVEAAQQSDGTSPTGPTTPAPPQLQPLMAFANGIPGTPGVILPYHMVPSPLTPLGFGMPPTMYRRGDSASSEMLAGPLTPGHQPSTPSGTSSPYPSDLSLNPGSRTHTESGSMTTAELRRISIASSVLKKKKPSPSESGESSAPSAAATSSDDKSSSGVEGLGIRAFRDVSSTFPSAITMTPAKKHSTDSVDCSTASSSPPAERHILITPSESEHNGDHSPKSMSPLLNGRAMLDGEPEVTPKQLVDEPKSLAEPMFASLAHTPEQLAEIARMRQSAIRDRERKSRAASVEVKVNNSVNETANANDK